MKKVLRKIRNYITKLEIAKYEKTFNNLKYCYYQNKNSNSLIVSFSAFPGKGGTAKYNYVKTLKDINVNKIFLLDDIWNPVNIGSYYLGRGGDWYLERDILNLLRDIIKLHDIDKVIMIGSSKGGTSALYYSIKLEADACVVGAPQYHIGNYLSSVNTAPIMDAIMGNHDEKSKETLNNYIPAQIYGKHDKKPEVYIHYSPMEHTYMDHIKDMIDDLHKNNFRVIEDNDYSYKTHSEVARYFPDYLIRTVSQLLQK